jgi:hypothetical protein
MSEMAGAVGGGNEGGAAGGVQGSTPVGTGQQAAPNYQQSQQQQQPGNPAWQEFLDVLPSQLHPVVTPVLQKWDKGVQSRFEQVQSQYAPYKQFLDNGVNPNDIEVALGIAQQINGDPRQFYNALTEYLQENGLLDDQGQQDGYSPEFDLGDDTQYGEQQEDPRLQEFEQQQAAMANWILQQEQQRTEQQADQELDQELNQLQEKYGEFDMGYVLSLAVSGMPLEDAVNKYQQLVQQIQQSPTPGSMVPRVMSPGGGLPAENVDPTKMSSGDTKNLVAQMLASSKAQRQG